MVDTCDSDIIESRIITANCQCCECGTVIHLECLPLQMEDPRSGTGNESEVLRHAIGPACVIRHLCCVRINNTFALLNSTGIAIPVEAGGVFVGDSGSPRIS